MSEVFDMQSAPTRLAPTSERPLARLVLPEPANINGSMVRGQVAGPVPATEGWYARAGKRGFDLLLILATLPLSLPIIVLCALALSIEGGQPFYWQERLGQGGRRFRILKLRTMVRDAEALLAHYIATDPAIRDEWTRTQKLRRDPRITRIGNILRVTSLDELPQLWNVVKGEMSLVGPRPMMPDQLPLYGDAACYHAVKPGITGLWQVSARNEREFSHRAEVDAAYCRSMSLWRDLVLMVRTVGVVLRRTGV